MSDHVETLRQYADGAVPEDLEAAIRAVLEQNEGLKAQLPEGMQHCTIQYIKCHKGHGRLVATNWIDPGCFICKLAERNIEVARVLCERVHASHGECREPDGSLTEYRLSGHEQDERQNMAGEIAHRLGLEE